MPTPRSSSVCSASSATATACKILNILLRAGGEAVCVCEFTDQLGLAQPTVSYHLKQLMQAGLLDREKRGTFAYFRVRADAMRRLHSLVEPAALARAG